MVAYLNTAPLEREDLDRFLRDARDAAVPIIAGLSGADRDPEPTRQLLRYLHTVSLSISELSWLTGRSTPTQALAEFRTYSVDAAITFAATTGGGMPLSRRDSTMRGRTESRDTLGREEAPETAQPRTPSLQPRNRASSGSRRRVPTPIVCS